MNYITYITGHPVYVCFPSRSFFLRLFTSFCLSTQSFSTSFFYPFLSLSLAAFTATLSSLRVPSVSLDRRLLLSLSLSLHCTLFHGVTLFLPNCPSPCSLTSFLFVSLYLPVIRRCLSLVVSSFGLHIFFSRSLFRSLNRIHYLSVFQFILSFSYLYIYF